MKCISTDWIDHYFKADWDKEIPAPPQGWGPDANELQKLEPLKQCSQKLSITINHIQQYLSSDCWSWDVATRTISFKNENQTEDKLCKLYQIILKIWRTADSQRVNSHKQGFLFYDYGAKLPRFPFKITCSDGIIELDCLQQARLIRNSKYFKTLFTSGFSEVNKREVSYPDIPIKSLKNIIDVWCSHYVTKEQTCAEAIIETADRFLLSTEDPILKKALEAALDGKLFYIKPLPICSERVVPAWIDHYFQADWDSSVPAPLEGWSASEAAIFENSTNSQHRCAEQLWNTIRRIQQYLRSKEWSWDYVNKTIDVAKDATEKKQKELKLFRLYQVILNIWKVAASDRVHQTQRGCFFYECEQSLPTFGFKVICKDGKLELNCLQQAYLSFDSPYFEQLFTSPYEAMKREVSYSNIPLEGLKDTVDAWCTNKVEVGKRRAQAIVKMADQFFLSVKDPILKEAIEKAL